MLERMIGWFCRKHILTNLFFVSVFAGGIVAWHHTNKEEMPDVTFDRLLVSVNYPGATAEEVEYFVTKPIEQAVAGIDGVYKVTSTSGTGSCSVTIEIEEGYTDKEETITDIRNAVQDVDLPEDITDDPEVRMFKTSKKAIIDAALFIKDVHILDVPDRRRLQMYAYALEQQLLSLPQVNSVNKSGYLQEEIQIRADPQKLIKYELPFNTVMSEIRSNNVRQPAGTIETPREPKVTLMAELDNVAELNELAVQGGFEGNLVRLKDVAEVELRYEKNKSIVKVNGREAVLFSVVKNSSYGILEALKAVTASAEDFRTTTLKGSGVELIFLDDESIDVRNRLSIIGVNGAIGFLLIIITLFTFLNKRSGLWVAMGIPFTFCLTMIIAHMMGYTINNTTLAAVIIVMGMIVDDAIVVAENITRRLYAGEDHAAAAVKGTAYMVMPVTACIVTTCVAFLPLYFFRGHGGRFIQSIPPVIFMMLGSSLLEAVFILPGHMLLPNPFSKKPPEEKNGHWFDAVEDKYARMLEKVLRSRWIVLGVFVCLLVVSGFIVTQKMKFEMFPNEETRDIVLMGELDAEAKRYETAEKAREVEDIIMKECKTELVGVCTEIARSRRGGAVEENKFRSIIEIVPKEKRKRSADKIIKTLESRFTDLTGFRELKFQKSRWGHSSGVPVEVMVQENNDDKRKRAADKLVAAMEKMPELENVDTDRGLRITEYKIDIDREKTKRLSIDPKDIASTFRAALEGTILYDFPSDDEDIDVRFTIIESAKDDINKVLDLPVENKGSYLVPLRDVVKVEEGIAPNSISREEQRRTTIVEAGIKKTVKKTPLEIAAYLENNVFPELRHEFAGTVFDFAGEIRDSRESGQDLKNAVIMVLFLIYVILAVLFESMLYPVIVMLAIPFGVVGIILAFAAHGKIVYGFFAAVGALGLSGVVVNDAIIMLIKLRDEFALSNGTCLYKRIAEAAKTRLRAVMLTTVTTVAGLFPTAYGFAGYDAMLAEMMLALTWGLVFATMITLFLIPCIFSILPVGKMQVKVES